MSRRWPEAPSRIDFDMLLADTRLLYQLTHEAKEQWLAVGELNQPTQPATSPLVEMETVPTPASQLAQERDASEPETLAPPAPEPAPIETEKTVEPADLEQARALDEISIVEPTPESPDPTPVATSSEQEHKAEDAPAPLPITEKPPVYHQPTTPEIRKMIGVNDKYLFISELFRGNSEAYEQALHHIEATPSLEAALRWLQTAVAGPNHWEKGEQTVRQFLILLQIYYSRRDR